MKGCVRLYLSTSRPHERPPTAHWAKRAYRCTSSISSLHIRPLLLERRITTRRARDSYFIYPLISSYYMSLVIVLLYVNNEDSLCRYRQLIHTNPPYSELYIAGFYYTGLVGMRAGTNSCLSLYTFLLHLFFNIILYVINYCSTVRQ
jgi:hypothetical protein